MKILKHLFLIVILFIAMPAFSVGQDLMPYIYGKASIGDVSGLKNLKSNGISLESTDAGGNTAYCLAVSRRNQTAIWALEQAGANTRPGCLGTFLVVTEKMIYRAASRQDTDQLKQWQTQGVNIDSMNPSDGNTALCQAVYEKNCKAIDILLKAGASEYHACMRRVPEIVRKELDCRPIVINWSRIGMTVVGAGLVAGGLAVAFSGGGSNSGKTCAENQHWENGTCVSCPAGRCWTGTMCRETKINEYTDPKTDRCMEIAPSPYKYDADVAESFKTDEYNKGDFLQHIGAADAYARGYSGYIIPRLAKNPYGVLENEQQTVSEENTPVEADKDFTTTHNNGRVRVAVLSTGTFIHDKEVSNSTSSGTTTTTTYTVNRDLAHPETKEQDQTTTSTDGTISTTTMTVATGKWAGNLATDNGDLVGNNFDIGIYGDSKQEASGTGYTWRQIKVGDEIVTMEVPKCLGYDSSTKSLTGKDTLWETGGYESKSLYYTSGTKMYFLGTGTETDSEGNVYYKYGNEAVYLVLYDASKTRCGARFCGLSQNYNYVPLESCSTTGDTMCFSPPDTFSSYTYDPEYVLIGSESNPDPHYTIGSGYPYNGTALAGIIAALRNNEGMHGVAYNAEVVPAIADVVLPVSEEAIKTLVDQRHTNIIVQGLMTKSVAPTNVGDEVITIAGYAKGKTMSAAFGTSAANGYMYAADNNIIYLVGTGDNARNTLHSATETTAPYVTLKQDVTQTTNGVTTVVEDNSYRRDATLSAGVPLTNDSTQTGIDKLFMAVTSVIPVSYGEGESKTEYVLPIYAQPCGSAAKYCLSAPGGTGYVYNADGTTISQSGYGYPMGNKNLTSTGISTSETIATTSTWGTASAASVVAGAAAVLKGAYPHLTSQEIVTLLFQTATPLGACAPGASSESGDTCHTVMKGDAEIGKYSDFYGWGLVDLDKATQPVGALWVNNGSSLSNLGANYLQSTNVTTSSAVSASLLNALPASFTAFDSYNRPFAVDINNFVSARSARKDFDDDFKAFLHGRDVTKTKPNDQFTMTYAPRTSRRYSAVPTGLMEMNVDLGKSNFGFYYTEDTLNARGNYFERVLNNPFIQMQEAYGAEAHYSLTSKLSIGMNYATGKNGFLGDGDKHHKAPENALSMVSTDAAYQLSKSVVFKASYGVMKEDDSVLGMMGSGAFKIDGATTNFVSAGIEVQPTDRFKLNLVYTYGWTKPDQNSSLMQLSKLTSDGFAATAQYDLGSDNMVGFSVSSPLRVRSGQVAFDLPVGRSDTNDTVYRQTFTGSMKPTARELDFALYYKDALSEALTIQSELGLRLHPDHQKDAKPDYRAMMGLKWTY